MSTACFAPVVAATGKTVKLAMQRLWLTGQVLPAGARLTVQHVFRSEEDKALEVIYSFPLPRDAALRRFRITGDGFEAESELRETEAAIKAYEEGIAQGSLSTLARQHGDGIINLTVGNIRPKETVTVYLEILAGVELRDDGFRFRFPFTLAPAYHARAKAAVVAPGEAEVELPADEFGDVILPRFREDASRLHQVGFDLEVASQLALDELGSPSHGVRVKLEGDGRSRVTLATEKDMPNRDLILDAHLKNVAPQILAGRDKEGKGRFAAIIPSSSFGQNPNTARRVVILLDRSGSMEGEPLEQARKAITACLGALSENDLFGLIAFDDAVENFQAALTPGTRDHRDKAQQFLQQIGARGGTELAQGFQEAAKLLRGQGGDVLILTDGQVFGAERILAEARATGVRLHCLGIGSASQDRFLALLARETGGVSRFVTPRERVDLSAVDLFASVGRPVASGLKAKGNIQPEPPAAVFSGTPVLVFGEVDAASEGALALGWDGGKLNLPVTFSEGSIGETVWLLQGSRLITDWESRYQSAEGLATLDKRKLSRVSARLRKLSQTYGLASREMSLVAVVKRKGDRAGDLPETCVVPVGMAQDTMFDSYFGAPMADFAAMDQLAMAMPPPSPSMSAEFLSRGIPDEGQWQALLPGRRKAAPPSKPTVEDLLMELASQVDSDGGMPGKDAEARAGASIAALFAFLSHGHTPTSGAFRSHVSRLVAFLKSLQGLSPKRQALVDAALDRAAKGRSPAGDWLATTRAAGNPWKQIAKAAGA